jgi:hypothetical protein
MACFTSSPTAVGDGGSVMPTWDTSADLEREKEGDAEPATGHLMQVQQLRVILMVWL